jgi:hypothetical protein
MVCVKIYVYRKKCVDPNPNNMYSDPQHCTPCKNDLTRFVLSLPKTFTRHGGTKMIMEFIEDVSYQIAIRNDESTFFEVI